MKIFLLTVIFAVPMLIFGCGDGNEGGAALPVLMYHHVAYVGDGIATVSEAAFEAQMAELLARGFSAVSFSDVTAFVCDGVPLPKKPVLIVFDDGYLSNFELAFPILAEHDFKAGIAVIGSSVGNRESEASLSHFSWDQARRMTSSGIVELASHTYAMHTAEHKGGAELIADHEKMQELFLSELSSDVSVFAYPHGVWDSTSEKALRALGVRMTLISDEGINTLIPNDESCLYLLRRFNICETVDFSALLDSIERYY